MKKLFLVLALIASVMSCEAQLLWKISGNGLKSPSYLFGTHHIAPATMLDSIPGLRAALDAVEAVYGEVDMRGIDDQASMQAMMKYAMAPADSTLSKVFTAAEMDSIDTVLKKYTGGMVSAQQMEPMKPTVLASQLAVLQSMVAFPGFDPAKQLDKTVQTVAKAAGKEINGFETIDFQMEMLFGEPIMEQARSLMKAIRNDNDIIGMSVKLAQLYLQGDLEGLEELMLDPVLGMDESAAETMLYNRNSTWAKMLLGILPTASVFIAVGAGHLPGEKGLINLLRKSGFTVTPVE